MKKSDLIVAQRLAKARNLARRTRELTRSRQVHAPKAKATLHVPEDRSTSGRRTLYRIHRDFYIKHGNGKYEAAIVKAQDESGRQIWLMDARAAKLFPELAQHQDWRTQGQAFSALRKALRARPRYGRHAMLLPPEFYRP